MACMALEILRDHSRRAGTSLAMMASSWSPELPKPPGMRRSWSTFRKNMPPGTAGEFPDQEQRIADAQPAAVVADDVLHGRVLEHQLAVLVDLGLHDLEREPVVATQEADQLAGILHRQKPLGASTYR
ncbi:hypothetical protein G6F57_020367 [Rhizopus arrhizus]|nr:hypothetical protein G6F57_020367 [Rhizopus arrhizus]